MNDAINNIEYIPLNRSASVFLQELPLLAPLSYSVGIMAYNEEANIARTLRALLGQTSEKTRLTEIIVVASGCTDNTVGVVRTLMQEDERIRLLVQARREGKASAINLFLQQASSPILVMVGADIIPEHDALEQLCEHFVDPTIGMVGAHPMPVNDQETFVGHAVHLLWYLHDRMARRNPKLGEVVAFRNVIGSIPIDTAVDEISIQAAIVAQQLQLVYEPEAIVYNKGPMTVRDFLKQRRRIHAGHLKVQSQIHYASPTMKTGPIFQELLSSAPYVMGSPRQFAWTVGTIALESLARMQGQYDVRRNRSHHIWQAVASTKALEDEQRKLRRIARAQSVIVFHISGERARARDLRAERAVHTIVRKALPRLRTYLRKDDLLSQPDPTTLVVVLNAEQPGAEAVARRLKDVLERQLVGQRNMRRVSYHAVVFAE